MEESKHIKAQTHAVKSSGIVLKKKHIVIAVILLFVLVAGGVFVGLNWNNWFGNTSEAVDKNTPDIDPNAEDWQGTLPSDQGGNGTSDGIAIPGFKNLTFAADKKEQEVSFVNPEQNTCYFVISLILPDGTTVFKSKMIPPGKGLYKIELTKILTAGTYEKCVIKYETYKMDDTLAPQNGADVDVTLIVE